MLSQYEGKLKRHVWGHFTPLKKHVQFFGKLRRKNTLKDLPTLISLFLGVMVFIGARLFTTHFESRKPC